MSWDRMKEWQRMTLLVIVNCLLWGAVLHGCLRDLERSSYSPTYGETQ